MYSVKLHNHIVFINSKEGCKQGEKKYAACAAGSAAAISMAVAVDHGPLPFLVIRRRGMGGSTTTTTEECTAPGRYTHLVLAGG